MTNKTTEIALIYDEIRKENPPRIFSLPSPAGGRLDTPLVNRTPKSTQLKETANRTLTQTTTTLPLTNSYLLETYQEKELLTN